MNRISLPLKVVFYYEQDRWIAHCLEFDLLGDGHTKEEALASLSEAIELQAQASLEHNNPENLFTPAPGRYFQMFATGKHIAEGELQIKVKGVDVEKVDAREYDAREVSEAAC